MTRFADTRAPAPTRSGLFPVGLFRSGLFRIGLIAAWTCAAASGAQAADPPPRMNVVVVLADDQGWGDLSVHGNKNLSTPHIDSLAREGALFERFFVCPVCSPTRAEFLTGRYHPRGNVHGVSLGAERLDLDEKTLADAFQSAGWTTAAFGKWHNGSQYPYHPRGRGFGEFYGYTEGHWGDYFSPPLEHDGRMVQGDGFLADDLTNHAMQFIEKKRNEPFFCYLPLPTPHSPMQVPDRFYEKFKSAELPQRATDPAQEDLPFTRAALAMCENIDWNVGRLLAKLDELKLADRTIVVYFSDNGPNGFRWNGGMRGRKGSTDEGGVRSPLLVRLPGVVPAGLQVETIAGAIDLAPTLLSLAGAKLHPTEDGRRFSLVENGKPIDGVDLAPTLKGTAQPLPERRIFSHWAGKTSVRTQTHRLDAAGRLYDLTADPGQERDLAAADPALAKRLADEVAVWRKTVLAELERGELPYPIGWKEFPVATLPARDGLPQGKVRRSAKAPNSSYFTGWSSTDDRIVWNVAAPAPGVYDVRIHYACPAADVGSVVELSAGEARLEAVLKEANDPPLLGAEHDRAPRDSESYVKDFRPWNMGTIALPAGPQKLTLRALRIPGRQVMEVRSVTLERKP